MSKNEKIEVIEAVEAVEAEEIKEENFVGKMKKFGKKNGKKVAIIGGVVVVLAAGAYVVLKKLGIDAPELEQEIIDAAMDGEVVEF